MAFMDLPLDAPEKPNKGLEGGACNRRSCQAEPALWWNHGSHSWYCADCRRDIEFDSFNLRDWQLRWQPQCGHPMFETREMMDARDAQAIEARRAATVKQGAVEDESAVGNADAPAQGIPTEDRKP